MNGAIPLWIPVFPYIFNGPERYTTLASGGVEELETFKWTKSLVSKD